MKEFMRSSFCGETSCVEVRIETGRVFVRDSNDLESPPLEFTVSEWSDFIKGVKSGEFDI